jgi:hypothetical protein
MNKFKSTISAALALTFAAGSAIPVTAAPAFAPNATTAANGNVVDVQYRRDHDGYWFPAGAFIAGAIISGAIANSQSSSSGGYSAHVNWCNDRYRTYRSSDNTYMSSAGYRKECNSPYS